jgi:hypothetical protein
VLLRRATVANSVIFGLEESDQEWVDTKVATLLIELGQKQDKKE